MGSTMDNTDEILRAAFSNDLLRQNSSWAVFFDLDKLEQRYQRLEQAFPADALHAVAVKANPLVSVLHKLVERGAGLEAASMGEIEVAKAAGVDPSKIVYDSPAKRTAEIKAALEQGVHINADNLQEVERIAELGAPGQATIGIRINPVVGKGEIDATSVATETSKFGVSIVRRRRALVEAFRRHRWLNALHVHTGSQGCQLALLVEGVRRCVDFAHHLEKNIDGCQIDTIDIGGGLPVAYRPNAEAPTIEDYADALRREVPELFDRSRRVVTEFGRWLHAPCAFAASPVEYTKPIPGGALATIHFGADLMLRRAYRPEDWYHHLSIHTPDGTPRVGDETDVTIAGPLCFSGDVIADGMRLPAPEPSDYVVAHDVGAYTFSMWSRYCSRPFPPIYGFRRTGGGLDFEVLHSGETDEDLARFWG